MIPEHKVRLPGFTADSSLGSGRDFITRRVPSMMLRDGPPGMVIPQLRAWWPGHDCIPGCVCVTAEGCPCCGYERTTSRSPTRVFRRSRSVGPG
jgi:hypothetical protein